jgi:hypothetical protein
MSVDSVTTEREMSESAFIWELADWITKLKRRVNFAGESRPKTATISQYYPPKAIVLRASEQSGKSLPSFEGHWEISD